MAVTLAAASAAHAASSFVPLPVARVTKTGQSVPGAESRGVLANEPGCAAGVTLEFDLASFAFGQTPCARLKLGDLEKIPVKRPGQSAGVARGALHVLAVAPDGAETLAGSLPVKPGGTNKNCVVDITDAVNAALAQTGGGTKKIRLAARITGAPLPLEVYALADDVPVLELASPEGWTDDWRERVAPVTGGPVVYREACLALAGKRDTEVVLSLLYPAKKIIEVVRLGTGEKLREGADWILREGKLVLPASTAAPVQVADEFFLSERKDKQGNITLVRSPVKLKEGGWYHERQMEVTYEPAARDWRWPAALSGIDDLPRTKRLLAAKAPLSVIVFGDSISAGFNCSRLDGLWPYQQAYGELVARELRRVYGAPVTLMNHARAGGTSGHAATQADAQVAWFKPDLVLLAFGMNERNEERRVAHRENMEKIIDIVRARSPETEFVIITPMLNNSNQPAGLEPVKFIRDEALKIRRPGIARVDLTGTEIAMLERKNYLDLSGNGVNHPNDFLHRIYAMRVLEVLLPRNKP
ncbi:hypothetical protein AW736_01190 [Termitidicoccus mucosus]|uniref:SGNH hydrolase-type esterase domain-containing protein n=2 Tax=Termitidicoccus mucosus TaxID=1184151 RepID=A0A178IQY7_9BACT|nr:hypothetical protein AW736_01190 [Opitutaceae bacterium TSB47]